MKIPNLLVFFLTFIIFGNAKSDEQIIYADLETDKLFSDETSELTVTYQATNNALATGIGLRLHFNSSQIALGQYSERLFSGAQPFQVVTDDFDFDNDPSTDNYYLTSWADVSGSGWPIDGNTGEPLPQPVVLYKLPLTASENFTGTTLRFSASSVAAGFDFSANNLQIGKRSGSLDIDGNESFDALTDGLLILRSMFGLSGETLIDGTLAPDAIYTTASEIQDRISAMGSTLDIDNNSAKDALTDGLIILRYLFGLRGDVLTVGVLSSDAKRTSSEEIEDYLDSLMSLNTAAPVITSMSEFSVDENQTAIGTVTASDADGDSLTYSLSDGDTSTISIESSSGLLTFIEAPDYESKSSYSLTVSVTDGSNSVDQSITITVNDVNDPPYFTDWRDNNYELISGPSFFVDEDFDVNAYIGAFSPRDQDGDDFTFSISGDEISIDGYDKLYLVDSPDFEKKALYEAVLTISDADSTTNETVTLAIRDVDDEAPVFSSSSNFIVPENQLNVGLVSASDVDTDNNAITFSLSGSDASSMTLGTNSGILSFDTAPDYETKSSYTAIITASDGINSANQEITVTVTDLDDVAPVFTSDSSFNAIENQLSIGIVTTTDIDTDDTAIAYSLSGADASAMDIGVNSGILNFLTAPDYETKSSYSAIITASDGTNSADQSITVTIIDANDSAPVFTSSPSFSSSENETSIGIVTASDPDNDTLSYSLSGTDVSSISIGLNTGVLVFNTAPDYEVKKSYEVVVTASDGVNETSQEINISIINLNDNTPRFVGSASFSARENQLNIGLVQALDDDGDDVTYILEGEDSEVLSVESDSGILTFLIAPDFETKTSYSAVVSISDGTFSASQNVSISITDVDDVAPVITSLNFSAAENQTAIGTVTATDVDTDDSAITFSVSGSELSITPSGVLSFVSAPDYETKTSYSATVTASDGTQSSSKTITVSVSDINEAPFFRNEWRDGSYNLIEGPDFSSVENNNGIFGSFTPSDPDGDEMTFSVSGNEIRVTGYDKLAWVTPPDFETKSYYQAVLTVSDGVLSSSQNITVRVVDIDDTAPVVTSSATFSASENQTSIGAVSATDVDTDDSSLTYSISGSELLISSGGILSFVSAPDYETKSSYDAVVTVSDGVRSTDQSISVSITDVDDVAPVITSSSSFAVAENQTAIGTVTATDVDTDDSAITFSVSGSELSITSSGVLSFVSAPDYETKTSYSATVTASDGTQSSSKTITVSVTNVNDIAPVFTSSDSFTIQENTTYIGTVAATDVEGDSITYSVEFSIGNGPTPDGSVDPDTGELTFDRAPNYERSNERLLYATVFANDGLNSSSQDIAITVLDADDVAPYIKNSDSQFTVVENQTLIGTVTATDPDSDTIIYSISGGATGENTNNAFLQDDHESLDETDYYVVTPAQNQNVTLRIFNIDDSMNVKLKNASGDLVSETIYGTSADTIIDLNEVLEFNGSTVELELENTGAGYRLGWILKIDDEIIYQNSCTSCAANSYSQGVVYRATIFIGYPDASFINIDSGTGLLSFKSPPDYEIKTQYKAVVTATDEAGNSGEWESNLDITIDITDIDDTGPVITSSATFSASENQTSIGAVSATDVDTDDSSLTYSISGSELLISSGGILSFVSAPDYETKSSYDAVVTVSDGVRSTDQSISVSITDVDDVAPVITSLNFSAAENQTAIGTVTATDVDTDDSAITFSVSGSELSITPSGVLSFVSAPDYETKTSYSATVTASDGTQSSSKTITVSVTNVNEYAPVFVSTSSFTVSENQTSIGTVVASDADGDTLSFSLSGSDASYMNLNASSGVLTFASASDYEVKSIYSVAVSATDGANSVSQSVTVYLNNLNDEAPQFTCCDRFYPREPKTAIGTMTTTDSDNFVEPDNAFVQNNHPDLDETSSYLISPTAGQIVTLHIITVDDDLTVDLRNSNGELEKKFSYGYNQEGVIAVSDYLSADGSSIELELTNLEGAGYSIHWQLQIDGSVVFSNACSSCAGDAYTSGIVYKAVINIDSDSNSDGIGDNAVVTTYSISGTDASSMSIGASSGVLKFDSATDYETKSSYSATVTATDGTNSSSQNITVAITDVDYYQIGSNLTTSSENSAFGEALALSEDGTVLAVGDPYNDDNGGNAGQVQVYKLANNSWSAIGSNINGEASGDLFGSSIAISNNGEIIAAGAPNNDSNGSNAGSVRVYQNNDGTWTQLGSDINGEAQSDLSGQNIALSSDGMTLAIGATENDAPVSQNYNNAGHVRVYRYSNGSWTQLGADIDGSSGGDQSGSAVSLSSDGNIIAIGASNHDYEANYPDPRTGQVRVFQYQNSSWDQIGADIDGELEGEYFGLSLAMSGDGSRIAASTSNGNVRVYKNVNNSWNKEGSDFDGVRTVLLSADGNTMVYNDSGGLTIQTYNTSNDSWSQWGSSVSGISGFVTTGNYRATLSDNGNIFGFGIGNSVKVYKIDDVFPSITTNIASSINEGQTALGSVTADESVTWSTSTNDVQVSSDGTVSLESAADYETATSYSFTISATDSVDNVTTTDTISVSVNNLDDEAPTFTSSATFSAAENQTSIGTVTTTDPDSSSVTYRISLGGIEISQDGVLTFFSAPDYETQNTYTATVTATDTNSNSSTQNITVNVTNVNDVAPVFTSSATFSAAENQTSIGTVTAADVDSSSLTFSVSGSELAITSGGVLSFVSAPDYETKSSYTATVSVTDGSFTTTQSITVNVTNVKDIAPVFTSASSFTVDEQQSSIGTLTATDAEGDSITFSLSGTDASLISVASNTGVMTFNSLPDYETKTSYSVTATATDGVMSTTQNITITIREVQFELTGTAYVSKYLAIDSDIPNTSYLASSTANNYINTAPTLLTPTVVSGYTGHSGDSYDLFIVNTAANMYVNLDVVEYVSGSEDLDLAIYNSDGSSYSYSYTSNSTESNETINLPASGTYIIQVVAVAGEGPYLLTLGQRLTASAEGETNSPFIENEIVSYIPLAAQISIENGLFDGLSESERVEAINSETLSPELLETTPGLRVIETSKLTAKYKRILESSMGGNLSISSDQLNYLSHWKAMQRLKEINPKANYQLNYLVDTAEVFSADPLYDYQWNMRQINLDAALNGIGQEIKDIAVAVIDTGSPTVNSNAWNATNFISGGYDFVSSTSNGDGNGIDNDPTDPDSNSSSGKSHGTHVATTIGVKNDGDGLNGMAVKVLPLRVFPTNGESAGLSDILNAIRYAAGLSNDSGSVAPTSTPVKVINLSLSGGSWDCSIFADVAAQGISVVAAAGNDGDESPGNLNYPASCANVISVASTTALDERAYYSQFNSAVDIAAPGGATYEDTDGNGYVDGVPAYHNDTVIEFIQGTSMASPHVAGAIALMYAVDSNMNPSTVNSFLQNGYLTDDIGATGKDNLFGYGRLNLSKAVEYTLDNIGDNSNTYFTTSPNYIDYGDSLSQASITLSKIGSGVLTVTSLTASDATGLSYTRIANTDGSGTYTIYLDRGSMPNGDYQNRLYFNLSNGSRVSVGVYYRVGGDRSAPNLGKVYVGIYDSNDSLVAYNNLSMDGSLSFVANDIVDGDYYFIVSTNNDNDGYLCDYGELCEYYPEYGSSPRFFNVDGSDTDGAVIYLKPLFRYGGANAASADSVYTKNDDMSRKLSLGNKTIISTQDDLTALTNQSEFTRIPDNAIPIGTN